MTDQSQPESSESGGGDEFDLHTEAMRSRSSASSFSRRRDRFRVARTALYTLALVAVVGAFALAPGGRLGGALSAFGSSIRDRSAASAPPPASRAPALIAPYVTPAPTPTPTRVAYPTPTLPQGTPTALGPAPASCSPPAPAPRTLPATYSGAIGASPIWVAWFDGPHATRHISGPGVVNSRYGWLIAVIFAIEPSLTDPVVVRGVRLDNDSPLWMVGLEPGQTFTQATPSVAVALDPRQPGLPDYDNYSMGLNEDWAAWYGGFYIPAAGCYALTATWPGGSWRVTFAAGR